MKKKQVIEPGELGEPEEVPPEVCERGEEDPAALRAELDETRDRLLRLSADFDNYRKRAAREREDTVCFANEQLIGELLPVFDNLERALQNARGCAGGEAIAEGVGLIVRQLGEVLNRCGLTPIAAAGTPFDPRLHEAVGVVPSAGHSEGTVVTEVRRGYALKGKVVRPSMVLVARSAEGE
jgi:molecular chaperone GrpE